MVRPEVIRKRLDKLEDYLAILNGLQRYSFEEFAKDPEKYGAAERFLQLAIESIDDMGSHIIADEHLGSINSRGDIPALLCVRAGLSEALRDCWIRMIGFRNVLVHNYLDIDRRIVYDALHNRLTDIQALMAYFARFL